jgi:hypothetical protein
MHWWDDGPDELTAPAYKPPGRNGPQAGRRMKWENNMINIKYLLCVAAVAVVLLVAIDMVMDWMDFDDR